MPRSPVASERYPPEKNAIKSVLHFHEKNVEVVVNSKERSIRKLERLASTRIGRYVRFEIEV